MTEPMFERYTEKARRVLFFARYEASQSDSACIESVHILLGLIREPGGLAQRIFTDAAVPLAQLRVQLERQPGAVGASTAYEIPFSAETRQVLADAADAAVRRGHDVGPEHHLLAILRNSGDAAASALARHGVTVDVVTRAIDAGE